MAHAAMSGEICQRPRVHVGPDRGDLCALQARPKASVGADGARVYTGRQFVPLARAGRRRHCTCDLAEDSADAC
jgi:hypothetical protein